MKALKVFSIVVLFALTSAQLLQARWTKDEKRILQKMEKAPNMADKGWPSNCVNGFIEAMRSKNFKAAVTFSAKKFRSDLTKEIKMVSGLDAREKMQYLGAWDSMKVQKEYWPDPKKRGVALVEVDVKIRRKNKKILFTVEKNGKLWHITEMTMVNR